MENMIFKPANHYITEEQAQIYGERLVELQDENNGNIDVDIVVNDAQYTTSPLHDYFTWANDADAVKWRLQQARAMIGSINIIIKVDDHEQEVRAFQHLSFKISEKETKTGYTTTVRALSEPELRLQMIDKALAELNSWRKRYRQYKELGDVFAAIERTEEQLKLAVSA
jgi:hypothetical protein